MATNASAVEQLMTSREVAVVIGMPENTLRHWRSLGRGPDFVRCGHSVRYRPADLERWLDAATVRSEAAR